MRYSYDGMPMQLPLQNILAGQRLFHQRGETIGNLKARQ
jgi:hypothetical protein